jgi:hypothetical protein
MCTKSPEIEKIKESIKTRNSFYRQYILWNDQKKPRKLASQ